MSRLINLLPWRAQRIKRRALLWTALFSVGLAGIALGSGAWRWYIHQHIVQVRAMPPSEQQLQAQRDHTVRLRKRLETLTALHSVCPRFATSNVCGIGRNGWRNSRRNCRMRSGLARCVSTRVNWR